MSFHKARQPVENSPDVRTALCQFDPTIRQQLQILIWLKRMVNKPLEGRYRGLTVRRPMGGSAQVLSRKSLRAATPLVGTELRNVSEGVLT